MSQLMPMSKSEYHKYHDTTSLKSTTSRQYTSSSEESNSPTELNSHRRLVDKPPLVKQLTIDFTGDIVRNNVPDILKTATNGETRAHTASSAYVNQKETHITSAWKIRNKLRSVENQKDIILRSANKDKNNRLYKSSTNYNVQESKLKQNLHARSSNSCSYSEHSRDDSTPISPEIPERNDLTSKEENELLVAPWFHEGIPREITYEVLREEPVGAFIVRKSTSKQGCYALSLRVPHNFHQNGLAHYLIMRTSKGYKIKGFTKEFKSLTTLIIHHSVMPELLPCPLLLSHYNPRISKSSSNENFSNLDSEFDNKILSDFRKTMINMD